MKNHFPEDYCPQREKVLDLSRDVLSGNRTFARGRREHGRYVAKVTRREARELLARAASWTCMCGGDPEIDCGRCYSDDLPTASETSAGWGLPMQLVKYTFFEGNGDDLGQLFRWYFERTDGMNHYDAEEFLRAMFLNSPFGHSLKTRHAYDHLFEMINRHRVRNYSYEPRLGSGLREEVPVDDDNFATAA
jgi:hypothetical protein